ncbi:hypothetical protein FRB99_004594 [Tulasnella sp. 403]|nr:hypothetical protein FRB99_004594 [Tulasnella sp. 403]
MRFTNFLCLSVLFFIPALGLPLVDLSRSVGIGQGGVTTLETKPHLDGLAVSGGLVRRGRLTPDQINGIVDNLFTSDPRKGQDYQVKYDEQHLKLLIKGTKPSLFSNDPTSQDTCIGLLEAWKARLNGLKESRETDKWQREYASEFLSRYQDIVKPDYVNRFRTGWGTSLEPLDDVVL